MRKLTDKDVIKIRQLWAKGKVELKGLAEKYEVSVKTISNIVHGKTHAATGGSITPARYYKGSLENFKCIQAAMSVKDPRPLVRKKSFEVFYVDDPQQFHTPGDDGSRVDMMAWNFKPGWFWWPKLPNKADPIDDPVGPFKTEGKASHDAVNSPHWGEWFK